jgi:hypothetical protein
MKLPGSYWKQSGTKSGFKKRMTNEVFNPRKSKRRENRALTRKIKSIKNNKGFS